MFDPNDKQCILEEKVQSPHYTVGRFAYTHHVFVRLVCFKCLSFIIPQTLMSASQNLAECVILRIYCHDVLQKA